MLRSEINAMKKHAKEMRKMRESVPIHSEERKYLSVAIHREEMRIRQAEKAKKPVSKCYKMFGKKVSELTKEERRIYQRSGLDLEKQRARRKANNYYRKDDEK